MDIHDRLAELAVEFSGRMGLAAQRTDEEKPLLLNAEEIFPTASCIKVPVLVELFFQAREGTININEDVALQEEDQVPGTGVLKDLTPGIRLSLRDLATLAITVSDNTAANMLIDHLGQENINARMSAWGFGDIWLGTHFVFEHPELNVGSPESFLKLLLGLARRTLMPAEDCDQVLEIMKRQQHVDYIPRYLPYHRFGAEFALDSQLEIVNKVGMISGVTNDMAVVTHPDFQYVLVIFTKDCRDQRLSPDSEAALLVAESSRLVYEHFNQF
jgi:beta-lactamase class A